MKKRNKEESRTQNTHVVLPSHAHLHPTHCELVRDLFTGAAELAYVYADTALSFFSLCVCV